MYADQAALHVTRQDSVAAEEAAAFHFASGTVPASALTYAPASVVTVGDATFVFVSGHTGVAADTMVGHASSGRDLAQAVSRQTAVILAKIQSVLHSLGGTMHDIVRVRVYVRPPLTKDVFEAIHEARREYFTEARKPASTLVRVDALVRPDALIEIEADAIITTASGRNSSAPQVTNAHDQ